MAKSRVSVVLVAVVLLGFGMLLQSTAVRTSSKAESPSSGDSRQTLYFAYWSRQEGFDSSVFLNNAGARPLTVQPTLYSLSGRSPNRPGPHVRPTRCNRRCTA